MEKGIYIKMMVELSSSHVCRHVGNTEYGGSQDVKQEEILSDS